MKKTINNPRANGRFLCKINAFDVLINDTFIFSKEFVITANSYEELFEKYYYLLGMDTHKGFFMPLRQPFEKYVLKQSIIEYEKI